MKDNTRSVAPTSTPIPTVSPAAEVPLRLLLSQPAYAQYAAAAATVGMEVEEYLREHLIQTAHIDHRTAGLWFPASEVKRLQLLTARGATRNTNAIVNKLESMARFSVDGLEVTLDADVIDRASHNYRVRNGSMTVKDFAAKEMVNGLRQSVGLNPQR